MKNLITALLTTLALTGCGDPSAFAPICERPDVSATAAAIVGGTPSQDRRGTVSLSRGHGSSCTGTIIGPNTVLTAAHCSNMVWIDVDPKHSYRVAEEVAHPDWNGNTRNDLRLLYTEETLPEPYIEVATVAPDCEQLVAQGYGYGSNGDLHERNVETVALYDEIIMGTESICNGDSGGPLYAVRSDGTYVLVGVTSFGWGEPFECIEPVGFMNLLVLGEWVEERIR